MRLSDSAIMSKRCGACGKLSVRRAHVEQSIDAGGRSFVVTVFASKCASCGDVQIPLAEARRRLFASNLSTTCEIPREP